MQSLHLLRHTRILNKDPNVHFSANTIAKIEIVIPLVYRDQDVFSGYTMNMTIHGGHTNVEVVARRHRKIEVSTFCAPR